MSEEKHSQNQIGRAVPYSPNASGTIMTHLMTYRIPGGREYQLHDAEYNGRHYFDFRKYDQKAVGTIPTKSGFRANFKELEFLTDAVMRWRRYHRHVVVKEAKREF